MVNKNKSPLNRTIHLTEKEFVQYSKKLITLNEKVSLEKIINKTIHQNLFEVLDFLPDHFTDLLILDPPYNLNKAFNSISFKTSSISEYAVWIDSFLSKLISKMKKTGSVYFCGDWFTSLSIGQVLQKYFILQNRITWEREKGRGSSKNWKNNSEDIWFCTISRKFVFNPDQVKLNRKVIAPYKDSNGEPKDWEKKLNGKYRLTYPSNIWTDISVPFWSMPENTEHPTQKPEKLIAKLILASSNPGDIVFDPFLGSGTTSVVAKKLNRNFIGVEIDKKYACVAEKRLVKAKTDKKIQGYHYNIFWERNTLPFKVE
jgi:site-specific DNA-methyltransferase (adenine-specific)